MKKIKGYIVIFLVGFTLGILTFWQVHDCAPLDISSSDTTDTVDSTVIQWTPPTESDTTVAATIIYREEVGDAGESVEEDLRLEPREDIPGISEEPDEERSGGKHATARIEYENGDVVDITYSYDTELFDVRRSLAPRPVTTNFITREIKEYVIEPRAPWDKPAITFGAGCVAGATIILVTGYALGAIL